MTQAVALSDAQKNKDEIISLCQSVTMHGVEIGRRLLLAEKDRHWELLDQDEWEYLKDIGLSKRQADKLKDVALYVLPLPFVKPDDVKEIGTTKLVRLIGPARDGKLDEELWNKALTLSDLDLRRELGHHIPIPAGDEIECPYCHKRFKTKFKMEPPTGVAQAYASMIHNLEKQEVVPTSGTSVPDKGIKATAPKESDAVDHFKKAPPVQLSKTEVKLFDLIVKMGLDEDESTRRITKNLIKIHGEKVIKMAEEVVANGKDYGAFAQVLAGVNG